MKRLLAWLGTILVLCITLFFLFGPRIVDNRMNPVVDRGPYEVPADIQAFHDSLLIVDLHADQTLWDRDVLKRVGYGQVDLPRLQEGGVDIQVFSSVTKSPSGQNYQENKGDTDRITKLVIGQLWPVRTWGSLLERALYQSEKLHHAEARSQDLFIVRTRADLEQFLVNRRHEPTLVAGILAIEGMHAMEADLANFDRLYDAGFRMASTTHFFDNALSGSAHGQSGAGLTMLGKEMIDRQVVQGMMIDVAHISPQTLDDILSRTEVPLVFSHGGVQGTCPGPRNLSDEHILAMAERGSVIGIGYWPEVMCGDSISDIVAAMRHIRDLTESVENIALGSDFDGTVQTPFDTAGLALLTEALLTDGFTRDDVRAIMGENALRVFLNTLP
ncbi:MAG: dipeptidase [Rhodothermales bacterium]